MWSLVYRFLFLIKIFNDFLDYLLVDVLGNEIGVELPLNVIKLLLSQIVAVQRNTRKSIVANSILLGV